jgi:hypothetical protein
MAKKKTKVHKVYVPDEAVQYVLRLLAKYGKKVK